MKTISCLIGFLLISASLLSQEVCIENDTLSLDTIYSGVFLANSNLSATSVVSSGSNILLSANESITLLPGFETTDSVGLATFFGECEELSSLKDEVVVITVETNAQMISIDSNSITFDENTPQIDQIIENCILVSDTTALAPTGYLRKVVDVENVGTHVVFTTEPASLTEAFDFVNYSFEEALTDPDLFTGVLSEVERSLNTGFMFNLPDYPLGTDITLTGSFTLDPNLVFELTKFEGLDEPVNFKIGTNGTMSFDIGVEYSPILNGLLEDEIELYSKKLKPIVRCLPVPPPFFCFPVVIVPELEFKLIFELNGPAVNFNYQQEGNFEAVVRKINDNWVAENNNLLTHEGEVIEIAIDNGITGTIKLRVELDFDLYDLESIEAFVFTELQEDIDINLTNCNLNSTINVGVGLEIDVLEQIGFDDDEISLLNPFNLGEITFGHNDPSYTVFDIDGNGYSTVVIGDQEWLGENLKVSQYNDGVAIAYIEPESNPFMTEWGALTTPAYCWYDGDESEYSDPYGAIYNGFAVENGDLCPTDWHVPTEDEIIELLDFVGGEQIGGGPMKEEGTDHWLSPNTGATNSTGFTALPSGQREGNAGLYNSLGYTGTYWGATEHDTNDDLLKFFSFRWDQDNFNSGYADKQFGYSVRCIKDE